MMNTEETNTAAGTASILIVQEMRKHKGTVEDGLNILSCLMTNMLANFAMNSIAVERNTREKMTEEEVKVMMMLHMQMAEKLADCIAQVMGEP